MSADIQKLVLFRDLTLDQVILARTKLKLEIGRVSAKQKLPFLQLCR